MASPIQNSQAAFDQVGWSIQTFFGIALLINTITIAILAFSDGGAAVNAPVTVIVVFINVMAMIGLNSNIDDVGAVLADLSEEEKKRSLAELLIFGKSDTAGIVLPSK